MSSWEVWASSVLDGIGAPLSSVNAETLWAWSNAETSPFPIMHINNPLDTTLFMLGAIPWNTFGIDRHVWIYSTVEDGITATVETLLQPGFYPTILAHLRNSVPRAKWADACPDLGKWGTGCGWLHSTFGPVPDNLGDDMFTDRDRELLVALVGSFLQIHEGGSLALKNELDQIVAAGKSGVSLADFKELAAKVDAMAVTLANIERSLNAQTK
jgi:hypothetical protein